MFNSHIRIKRGGQRFRRHRERLFYIKHHGWFLLTRDDLEICEGMELHNGMLGPFATQNHAINYLSQLIHQESINLQTRPVCRKGDLTVKD